MKGIRLNGALDAGDQGRAGGDKIITFRDKVLDGLCLT